MPWKNNRPERIKLSINNIKGGEGYSEVSKEN